MAVPLHSQPCAISEDAKSDRRGGSDFRGISPHNERRKFLAAPPSRSPAALDGGAPSADLRGASYNETF